MFKHLLQHEVEKLNDADTKHALTACACGTGQAGWQEELALAKHVVGKYEHDEVLLTAYEQYVKYISQENPSLNLGPARSRDGEALPHVMELSA